jgi:hypothetical protein
MIKKIRLKPNTVHFPEFTVHFWKNTVHLHLQHRLSSHTKQKNTQINGCFSVFDLKISVLALALPQFPSYSSHAQAKDTNSLVLDQQTESD